MTAATDTFSAWLAQAQITEHRLRPDQRAVLQAAFRFGQRQGHDAYSTRLLTHFLLHCGIGLKVAQLARLVGVSRPTTSRQQGMSSQEAVQQVHHRMDGRPYGKLLPPYAGPIIEFLLGRPKWLFEKCLPSSGSSGSGTSQANVLAELELKATFQTAT